MFGEARHFERVLHALFAGAGVGVAGIDDECLRTATPYSLDADLHRRGADLIGREHAGDGRGHFGNDEREVALPALLRTFAGAEAFDVAEHAGSQKTFRRSDGTVNAFQLDLHLPKNRRVTWEEIFKFILSASPTDGRQSS